MLGDRAMILWILLRTDTCVHGELVAYGSGYWPRAKRRWGTWKRYPLCIWGGGMSLDGIGVVILVMVLIIVQLYDTAHRTRWPDVHSFPRHKFLK